MKKEIICTVCPRGCHILVEGDEKSVFSAEGYSCKRGLEYANTEYLSPVRILTTTVKISGIDGDLLPVRSAKPLPKDKLSECMDIIKKTEVKLPVKRYDTVIADICGTGTDIVATKDIG
ncbi:MAG: DUF1667 domain-containing protein [Clostridia bacterium]|nr:DUF1667 domain-containing protein [Clostridia bacterium]